MNKLKENLKDWITDLIGLAIIIVVVVEYFRGDLELWPKATILFLVGVAFFFIPDDILSQMAQKFINKKLDKDDKLPGE